MSVSDLKEKLDPNQIKKHLTKVLADFGVNSKEKLLDDTLIVEAADRVYGSLPTIPIRALIRVTIKKEGFTKLIFKIRDKMIESGSTNLDWLDKQQLGKMISGLNNHGTETSTIEKGKQMKLYIKRDQSEQKSLFGKSKGISFSLTCRLELADNEKNLIEKYKQWEIPVYTYETVKGGIVSWSLRDLTTGNTVNCDGVATLLSDEESIKEACGNIRVLLEVMESFGGEEVIEY